jgi:signal transduction histidine kinase
MTVVDLSHPHVPEGSLRTAGRFFETVRHLVRTHPLSTDGALAITLLFLSTVWLSGSPFASLSSALVQAALLLPLIVRRVRPFEVFAFICAVALVQWILGYQLIGDVAVLVGLYTVAAHESRARAFLAAGVLEAGAVMAAVKWEPAGTVTRSLLFLSATVVASLFAGMTVASGSRYLEWLDERARRLEMERDQQAVIATGAERTRIARELHDIVSHSLSVVITLADAAALVNVTDPERGSEAMLEVSDVGRHALSDMRAMLGVLRTDESRADLAPQPKLAQIETLVERVRSTGLIVHLSVEGTRFALGDAAELTTYRIIQEALTNTIRHAGAKHAWVTIRYEAPEIRLDITDDGIATLRNGGSGHGIAGMSERAALHRGILRAGPSQAGGWSVSTTLQIDPVPAQAFESK